MDFVVAKELGAEIKADYPSAVLRPGEVYEQAIIFAFGVK